MFMEYISCHSAIELQIYRTLWDLSPPQLFEKLDIFSKKKKKKKLPLCTPLLQVFMPPEAPGSAHDSPPAVSANRVAHNQHNGI